MTKYSLFLACAAFGLVGISTTAKADDVKFPYSTVCQSAHEATNPGDDRFDGHDCGADANPQVLVPKRWGYCFYLTDYSAENNNSPSKRVDLLNGTNSRANLPKAVLAAHYNGGHTLTSEHWITPLVFDGNLYADVWGANGNVMITVSGYYAKCPRWGGRYD